MTNEKFAESDVGFLGARNLLVDIGIKEWRGLRDDIRYWIIVDSAA